MNIDITGFLDVNLVKTGVKAKYVIIGVLCRRMIEEDIYSHCLYSYIQGKWYKISNCGVSQVDPPNFQIEGNHELGYLRCNRILHVSEKS